MPCRRLLPWILAGLLALPILSGTGAEESDRVKKFLKAFREAAPAGRTAAVQDWAKTWDGEAAGTLLALLKAGENPDVLIGILQAAGQHPDPGATDILKAGLALKGADDWRVRAHAAKILIARAAPGDLDLAAAAAEDPDGRVPQLLCDALASDNDEKALDILKPLLEHKDWRVRAAAIKALGNKYGSDPAAKLLMGRLRAEEGRLIGDLLAALQRVTGQQLGPDPRAWTRWMETRDGSKPAMEGTEAAEGYDAPPQVTYHGIRSFSHRILFVFDRTGSMTHNDNIGKEKKHLIEVIEAFGKTEGDPKPKGKKPPPVLFNIIMFSDGKVEAWQAGLVPDTAENKASAIAFVKRQTAAGWTNTLSAMKFALDAAKGTAAPTGVRALSEPALPDADSEPYGYGPKDADTIFLLSDGAPNGPSEGVKGKPAAVGPDYSKDVADKIRDYNRTKGVTIHTVGIGAVAENAQGMDQDIFMRRIAKESGGTYIKVP